MSFSDDPASPAAPFSGDTTGQIFDLPDMVTTSPTTNERIVDTQSGYLVVVKRLSDRLTLSVKRRVGTPPSSAITLMPDESTKLAKILASGAAASDDSRGRTAERERSKMRRSASRNTSESELPENPVTPSALSSAHIPPRLRNNSPIKSFLIPILAGTLLLLGTGCGIGYLVGAASSSAPNAVSEVNPLSTENIDKFVRTFVASMLDFGPDTYKASQVQAMAAMTPELMNRYWQETNFPLSNRQLKNLPQGVTILITELKQEPAPDGTTVMVDVRAQLTDPKNPKVSTPVNLRLKLTADAERRIQVLEQQDLTAGLK